MTPTICRQNNWFFDNTLNSTQRENDIEIDLFNSSDVVETNVLGSGLQTETNRISKFMNVFIGIIIFMLLFTTLYIIYS